MKWRKLNNLLHRDIGYFFFGMTIIYAVSGVVLNHMRDFDPNPSYKIVRKSAKVVLPDNADFSKKDALRILNEFNRNDQYRKHIIEYDNDLKIYFKGGTLVIDSKTGQAEYEKLVKRPILFEFNLLHYNTAGKFWKWFSDIFALGLFILAVTGLFVLKGKNGLKRRGIYFVIGGIIIPIVILILVAW